jgi:hypothetical protein
MLVAAVMTCALAASRGDESLSRRIDASLERAREALLSSPELARGRGTTGERALAALAALRAGAAADGPVLSRALGAIIGEADTAARDAYGGAYHAGLFLMLLEELGPRADDLAGGGLARKLAARLVEIQLEGGGWGDVSRTEFACLGLRAAERMGESVPEETWARAERFLVSRRDAEGGWGYREGDPATGSMTAGACAALVTAGLDAGSDPVRRGLAWLGLRFRTDANPSATKPNGPAARSSGVRHRFYYLSSLAVFARELGRWPDPSWAEEGALALIGEQLPGGGWQDDPQDRPTEFATLFLVEAKRALGATPPAVVTVGVCSSDGRFPPRGAGASLTHALGRWTGLDAEVRFARATPRSGGSALEDFAFVLALAGKTPLRAGDVAELARFVDAGGTVLVEGQPSMSREDVLDFARRVSNARAGQGTVAGKVGAKATRPEFHRVMLAAPAPLSSAEMPEFLSLGEGLLVAPAGVFGFGDAGEVGPPRSAARRVTVNAFTAAAAR